MKLLKELSELLTIVEAKHQIGPKCSVNNLPAKHSVNKTGAGTHEPKVGQLAKRQRQKRNWKNEVSKDM